MKYGWFHCKDGHSRQRYICHACRRTFSDLTSTAFAYCKKLPRWQKYSRCMMIGLSIRTGAAEVGVHPSTAFRWRHRILSFRGKLPLPVLSGRVELGETSFRYSEKGSRCLSKGVPRKRGLSFRMGSVARIYVLLARDQERESFAMALGGRRPSPSALMTILRARIAPESTLLTDYGYYYGLLRKVYPEGMKVEPLSMGLDFSNLTDGVDTFRRELRLWLDRFHGVATRYLTNYLGWFRFVDRKRFALETVASRQFLLVPLV